MAKRTKTLVGLDIDATGIVAASVVVNGRVRVERAAFAPLEPGIIRDGEVADVEGLAEALRDAVPREQGPGQARPGRPRQPEDRRARHRPALPRGRQGARRRGALPGAGPASDAARARRARPPAARRPQRRRRAAASACCSSRRAARWSSGSSPRCAPPGLKPEGVDLSAFATVRALHRAGPDDELVLYLAIGGLTNLAVARGTECTFARASGSGVEALAVELAERAALTLEHAYGWLAHVGVQDPVEDITGDRQIVEHTRQILLDGVRRIASEVRSSLDFHRMQEDAGTVSRAVMTGPASAIPGFDVALASELGIPVEQGLVDGAPAGIDAGRVTVAAGLALMEAPA